MMKSFVLVVCVVAAAQGQEGWNLPKPVVDCMQNPSATNCANSASGSIPQFPSGAIPQFPSGAIPQFPSGAIPQFPGVSGAGSNPSPATGSNGLPSQIPNIPNIPNVPSIPQIPNLPGTGAAATGPSSRRY